MEVFTSDKDILGALRKHLGAKSKISVVCKFGQDVIYTQSNGDYILDIFIPATVPVELINKSVSFIIDKTINLFNITTTGTTTLDILKERVIIKQPDMNISYTISFDKYFEIDFSLFKENGSIDINDFNILNKYSKNFSNLIKTLDISNSNIKIIEGSMYIDYSNMIIMSKVSDVYPNLELLYSVVNSISKNFTSGSIILYSNIDTKLLLLKYNNLKILLSYKIPNHIKYENILNVINNSKYINSYNFKVYNSLKVLYSMINKGSVSVSFNSDGSISYTINSKDGKYIVIGNSTDSDLRISISIGQLDSLIKTYSDCTIKLYKGNNTIILENGTFKLLLSGFIY